MSFRVPCDKGTTSKPTRSVLATHLFALTDLLVDVLAAVVAWRGNSRREDAGPYRVVMATAPITNLASWQAELAASLDEGIVVYRDAAAVLARALRSPETEREAMRELADVAQRVGLPLIGACRAIEELSRAGNLEQAGHPRAVLGLARVLAESLVLMLGPRASAIAARPLIDPAEVARLRAEPGVTEWFALHLSA